MYNKKVILPLAAFIAVLGLAACSAQGLRALTGGQSAPAQQANQNETLSDATISNGLKAALMKGVKAGVSRLGQKGGFWNSEQFRIPLPSNVQNIADIATQLGQGDKVKAFCLSLNRAAEKAVPQVADIFVGAIKNMSLSDVRQLLAGGDHAVTDFFRRKTANQLQQRILPIVDQATDQVGVTRQYKSLVGNPAVQRLAGALTDDGGADNGLNLNQYVTHHAVNALFEAIGEEEAAIRHNPAERTTDLLRQVFGG